MGNSPHLGGGGGYISRPKKWLYLTASRRCKEMTLSDLLVYVRISFSDWAVLVFFHDLICEI